ncbi:hypothetical protein Patl1_28736 [Pistacia atlantica]|uniref:Uncharacterized protein n=1 Tax=Pistacia atlantica TaxID=434234 RepID=A0ACC1BG09_9ROSI|nr:hypothetical protein Patl1_28736 [Pistacia atlantica]
MDKCVILLALIACSHAILWVEGRQLKYKEKEETAKHDSNNINLHQDYAELKVDLQSTKPSVDIRSAENTLHVTRKKEIFPPIGFGESAASDKHDFRPTTPGNSPGVGHKHAKEEEDVESKVVVNHSLKSGFKNDVRPPPAPGHIP